MRLAKVGWRAHRVLDTIRVSCQETLQDIRLQNMHPIQLVAQSHPVRLAVVLSTKQFNLPCARQETLNHTVNLIWLVTSGTDLCNYHITVNATVHRGIPLRTHQTMFLAMVDPVSSSSRAYEPLQLVCLDPQQFIDPLIPPECQALSPQLHGTT